MLFMVLIGSSLCRLATAEEDVSADTSAFTEFLKSFDITETELRSRIGSTNMFGGSSPVSFSGEGRVKLQHHFLSTKQEWMVPDLSYIQSGWEGNESLLRLAMVARAGRNTVLYSKIGFQHTLPGNRYIGRDDDGFAEAQTRHDKSLVTANIHEDMGAGMAIRTVPASFWLRMGNVNWVEASPFTIWKAQPRTFAWEFLPFEIEQPIARYYEYNVAKGEKAGRAAWHKKPFNGINFESISLPAHLYFNLVWGTVERYDNFEREYIDFAGDRGYSNPFPLKATGIGDSYRHMFHARLARNKLAGDLTLGLNYNRLDYRDDIFLARDAKVLRFVKIFDIAYSNTDQLNTAQWNGTGFYKEPQVWSLDLRGKIGGELMEIHSDVAVGRVDTTFLTWRTKDTIAVQNPDGTTEYDTVDNTSAKYEKRKSSSKLTPAFFTQLHVNAALPFQVDLAMIGQGFYSPSSFVAPTDAFYAFGSNLVGSGKFLARQEASPYVQNMAGVLLSATPKLSGYGHLRVAYGQHFQLKEGRDVLYMPYRLNGLDLSTLSQSSYARWGSGPTSLSIVGEGNQEYKYQNRLGDQSFRSGTDLRPFGMDGGDLYIDYLSANECFVPYPDSASAAKNYAMSTDRSQRSNISYTRTLEDDSTGIIDTSYTGFVPKSRKFTNNFEIDAAYDISDLIGYNYNLFIGGYAAINNVTGAFSPLAVKSKGDDVKLWSIYLRFEPAIQLTKKFYLLGILGFENWRSEKAWMYLDDRDRVKNYLSPRDTLAFDNGKRVFNVPIDYRDAAVGLGFDWEILNRVGLHFRAKYMQHKDVNFTLNNWATPITSLEIKTWF
jgi:hypothetical protein